MPCVDCLISTPIQRTPRVLQVEGLFDVPPAERSVHRRTYRLPLEERSWNIGLIVGPSGCGKTQLALRLFGDAWSKEIVRDSQAAVVDLFPPAMDVREITSLLSSVGFSSPPAWLRPYEALSTGEQFRARIAIALAERPDLAIVDEFTSVVDRTVAQIASHAIARTVRRTHRKFVAVGCHYDVIDWLQPDWMFDPSTEQFHWRSLQRRPDVHLDVARVDSSAWTIFRPHHYLSGALHQSAACFVASVGERPAAFTAVLSHPGPGGGYWREHRTVCLPDFQGVGIGNALSEFVASLFRATGKHYVSVTSHPGMIRHRRRSPLWRMYRPPSLGRRNTGREQTLNRTAALGRFTAGFEYVGAPDWTASRLLGVVRSAGDKSGRRQRRENRRAP